ncbi:hypothetical protein B566_EDAN009342 [Ephemera danica]|nr:hypothetical protein B566_EDAN009342 [Ephemera danica]
MVPYLMPVNKDYYIHTGPRKLSCDKCRQCELSKPPVLGTQLATFRRDPGYVSWNGPPPCQLPTQTSHSPSVQPVARGLVRRSFSLQLGPTAHAADSAQHLSVTVSRCQLLVEVMENSTQPCLSSLSLRPRALPFLPSTPASSQQQDPYQEAEGDSWGELDQNANVTLHETRPHTDTYYYLLVAAEAQASFTCQKFDLRNGWVKLLNNGFLRRPGSSSFKNETSSGSTESSWSVSTNSSSKLVLDASNVTSNLSADPQQVEEFFISSLLLPDGEPVLVRLDILPFLDIGGSLSIGLQLDRMLLTFFPSTHLLKVRGCLRKGRPPPLKTADQHNLLSCPDDLALSLSSRNRATTEGNLIVPFPEPGPWFLAIQATCTNNGSRVACIPEELGLDLDIRIQPCVFAGEPCGPKGECERTHHGLHTFSSCLCFGGFSGWGCTDGRGASPPSRQLVGTLALTLSNLFFMPAVVLAAKRRLLAEALIYLATTLFSTLYHACDEPEYSFCVLQFCDFFCSILAFWVTLISLAHLPPRLAAAAHMAGVLVVAVGVEWNRTALVVFLVPVALGLLVPMVAWAVRSWNARNLLGVKQGSLLRILPGVLLAGLGLGLFAMVETEANYQFIHSAWHMLMGLALLFLLPESTEWQPMTSSSPRRGASNNPPLLDACSQELNEVNDCPVFVLTSTSTHQLLLTSES